MTWPPRTAVAPASVAVPLLDPKLPSAPTDERVSGNDRYGGLTGGGVALGVGLAAVCLTLAQLGKVPLYLSADAGHYLADADALFGHGVRDLRHLPVFPLLLGIVRLFVGDIEAVGIAMGLVLISLVVGFHVFIRGRVATSLVAAAGMTFFVLSPMFAEGVGWYGGSMLLGLALALVSMRLIDDAMRSPTPRRIAIAGMSSGLVGLTHPLSLLLLAQAVAVVVGGLWVRHVIALRRHGRSSDVPLLGQVLVLAKVTAIGAAMTFPAMNFYTEVESPLSIAFNPLRLTTLGRWAFREDLALWMTLLALSLSLLVPGAWLLNGDAGFRMGLWAFGFSAIPIVVIVIARGHPSYTTRYLYALPLTLACTVSVTVGLLARSIGWRKIPPGAVPAAVLVAVSLLVAVPLTGLRVGQTFVRRMDVALPYYNTVTSEELSAIRWLGSHPGTVAVGSKGGDKVAGTLYAWRIEGLARSRAIGTGEAFLSTLPKAHRDSLDIDRLASGTITLENARLRIGANEGSLAPVEISGSIDGDWFSLATLYVGPRTDLAARSTVAMDQGSAVLSLEEEGLELEASTAASGDAGSIDLTVRSRADHDVLSLDLRPSQFAANTLLRTEGGRATLERTIRGRTVRMQIEGGEGLAARVDEDVRAGAARIHLETAASTEMKLSMQITGVDTLEAPTQVYTDVRLLQQHDVRYLFTWRESAPAALLERRCFAPAYENTEVVILRVTDDCLRWPQVPKT